MEQWQDQGIVLSIRPHGENGGILSLLSENFGLCKGYVAGARSSKMRGTLEIGNHVEVQWQGRHDDDLGRFDVDMIQNHSTLIFDDALRLAGLTSCCALCHAGLPEREAHPGMYHGLLSLLGMMPQVIWGEALVFWELALLREMGFPLDLSVCTVSGTTEGLIYVSPKSGRAVSQDAGQPYHDKLLNLPAFMSPNRSDAGPDDIYSGLELTRYFLEYRAFAQANPGIPQERLLFQERFANLVTVNRKEMQHG